MADIVYTEKYERYGLVYTVEVKHTPNMRSRWGSYQYEATVLAPSGSGIVTSTGDTPDEAANSVKEKHERLASQARQAFTDGR